MSGSAGFESTAYARDAAVHIQNIFSSGAWPAHDNKLKWTVAYERLTSKNVYGGSAPVIYKSTYIALHKMLGRFFTTGDEGILLGNRQRLKSVFILLDNPRLTMPAVPVKGKKYVPLTDGEHAKRLDMILSAVEKHTDVLAELSVFLLEAWLRTAGGNVRLGECTRLALNAAGTLDTALYMDEGALETALRNTDAVLFDDALKQIGIEEKYITSVCRRYFARKFFTWIMRSGKVDGAAIDTNMKDISECTLDEVKVIFAAFFVTVHGTEGGDEAIQRYIDKMQMHEAGAAQYWRCANAALQSQYNGLLDEAQAIARPMLTRGFTESVLLCLNKLQECRAERVLFWNSYSRSISDIRLFMRNEQLQRILDLMPTGTDSGRRYAARLNKSILYNASGAGMDDVALIMLIGNIAVIDRLMGDKSTQILRSDNHTLENLIAIQQSAGGASAQTASGLTIGDLAVYDDLEEHQYKYNPDAEEGSVPRQDDLALWAQEMESLLASRRIYKNTHTNREVIKPYIRDPDHGRMVKDKRKSDEEERVLAQSMERIRYVLGVAVKRHNFNIAIYDTRQKRNLIRWCRGQLDVSRIDGDLLERLVMDDVVRIITLSSGNINAMANVKDKIRTILQGMNINHAPSYIVIDALKGIA